MRKFLVLLMLVAPLASPQSNEKGGRGATSDASAGAQAGDDALTCDQLNAEMNTLMTGSGAQSMPAQQQLSVGQSLSEVAKHPELLPKGSTGVSKEALDNLNKAAAAQGNPNAVQGATSPAADSGNSQASDSSASDKASEAGATRRPGLGRVLGQGLLSNFGGGRATGAAQQRELRREAEQGLAAQAAMNATATSAQAQIATEGGNVARGMHLAQLAQAKGCAQQAPPKEGAH